MDNWIRTAVVPTAMTCALVLTACGTAGDVGSSDASQDPATASEDADVADPAAVAEAIDAVRPTMVESLLFDVNPFSDYDAAYAWLDDVGSAIDELGAALPPLVEGTDEERRLYGDMLASLEAWRGTLEPTRTALEERRDELEPLNTAWFERFQQGDAGPPPAEYLEVIEVVNLEAATAWGDACARFADEADVAADCYAHEGPEPESDRTSNDP